MELILKIAAAGIVGALCAMVIRRHVPELGMVTAIVTGVLLLGLALPMLSGVTDFLDELQELSGLAPSIVAPMMKTAGIAIVTRCVGALCKDAGEGGISTAVETAGVIAALLVSLPLLRLVLQTLLELLHTGE
jgi:stage III sporulation protein AD